MKLFPEDFELVESLQKGDVEAFDLIYEKYSERLFNFGLKYLKSSDEAEELVQSVFLKIWENHQHLKKESFFKSYLFTIAYNDICKFFRRKNYLQKFINDTLYENSEVSYETEDGIASQSVMDRVKELIDKLPNKQRIIFIKSRIESKSTKEIAKELGLSPGTIDNYNSESLKFIRSCIRKEKLIVLLLFSVLSLYSIYVISLSLPITH